MKPAVGAAAVSLVPFGVLSFTYFAAIGLFNAYGPLWFKHLGFSTLVIGSIAALQSWTRVFVPYAWGWMGDHTGRRVELLRAAALVAAIASLGLLIADSIAAVAFVVGLLFLANGGIVPLSEASLAQHLSSERGFDTARYGRVRRWGSVGFLCAAVSMGYVLDAWGEPVFPWLVVASFALLLVASWRLPLTVDAVHPDDGASGAWRVLRQPAVAWFFASIFLTVLAHTGLYAFFSLYVDRLGFAASTIGLLWAVSVGVEIAFFSTQGLWFARLNASQWLLIAAAVSVLRFAAMAAFGAEIWVLVAAQMTHAITFAAHHAACITLVHRYFPGRLRGRGQALYTTLGYGVSGVIGGVAGGFLSQAWGLSSVFWAASACAALATYCGWRALRSTQPA